MKGLTSGQFANAAVRQSQTLAGQWDMLTGNVQKATGAMTLGLAGALSDDVLPAANKAAAAITEIFASDLPVEQQMRKARAVIVRELGPVAHEIGDQIEAAHLDQKLGAVLEKAAPVLADAAVDVGAQAAKAFARAWLESGIWVQVLSVAWLAKKLGAFGAFGALGALAASRFRAQWAARMAVPLPGPVVAPTGVPGKGGKKGPGVPPVVPLGVPAKGGAARKWGGKALRAIPGLGAGLLAAEAGWEAAHHLTGDAADEKKRERNRAAFERDRAAAQGGATFRGFQTRGGQMPVVKPNVVVKPTPVRLVVDRKVVAKTNHRAQGDRKARE